MHFKMLMISDLKKKKDGSKFSACGMPTIYQKTCQSLQIHFKINQKNTFSKLQQMHLQIIQMHFRCERRKKVGASFPLVECEQFLPRIEPPIIMPVLQPLVCTSAQNAQKSCAFSPNWIFFFCKTEFSLFSDEEFLRCHC